MTQKVTRQFSIRLELGHDKHARAKQIRRELEENRGNDLTLIKTYEEIVDMGIEAMEARLNITPLKETA